jgi:hypothetical protein
MPTPGRRHPPSPLWSGCTRRVAGPVTGCRRLQPYHTQNGNLMEPATMSTRDKPRAAPNPADMALMALVLPLVTQFLRDIEKLQPDERMRRINSSVMIGGYLVAWAPT